MLMVVSLRKALLKGLRAFKTEHRSRRRTRPASRLWARIVSDWAGSYILDVVLLAAAAEGNRGQNDAGSEEEA